MSRAFIKEDADTEGILIPGRAPLPDGIPNNVTPRGLALLETELAELTAERDRLQATSEADAQRARQLEALRGRIEALQDRLANARLVEPSQAPPNEVAFGSTVTVRSLSGKFAGEESRFTLVGVDEAGANDELVAFTAPVAQALLGRKVGERATLTAGRNLQELEIVAIGEREA